MIDTPSVDWLALSPTLALLAASAVALLGAVIVPRAWERWFSVVVSLAGFATSAALACVVFDRSPEPSAVVVESMTRDRLGAMAAVLIALVGLAVVLVSAGDGRRSHVGEYYALLSAARVSGYDPMWIYGLVLLPVATSAYFLWRLLLADSARRRFARAISACAALATFGVLWGFCYTLTS